MVLNCGRIHVNVKILMMHVNAADSTAI